MSKKLISIYLLVLFSLFYVSTYKSTPISNKNQVSVSCKNLRTGLFNVQKFQLACLDHQNTLDILSIKGPTIINVWGSWCKACKEEIPYFVELHNRILFKNTEIQLLGVNVEEQSLANTLKFIQVNEMNWPHLVDVDGSSKSIFGPGVPVTWFIDKNGKTIEIKIGGYTNKRQLFEQVEKAFGVRL